MLTEETLENRFKYHAPTGNKVRRHECIRKLYWDLAKTINELCPDSRETSTAITHLESSMFWANASIAREESNV
jgi:hypothetical protein